VANPIKLRFDPPIDSEVERRPDDARILRVSDYTTGQRVVPPSGKPQKPSPVTAPIAPTTPTLTISQCVAAYMAGKGDRLADSAGVRRRLYRLVEAFGNCPVSDLTATQIEQWVVGLGWRSPSSQLAKLGACFSWCLRCQPPLIESNPFASVRLDSLPNDEEPGRPCLHAEWLAILDAARGPRHYDFRRLLVFAYETGCRPMEIARLERRHIDLDRGVAIFPPREHKTGRRTKRPRQIVLSPVAMGILRSELARMHTGCGGKTGGSGPSADRKHLFVTGGSGSGCWVSKDGRASGLTHKFRRLIERNGLPRDLTLYSLRHSYGTRLAMAGVNEMTGAQLMGNSPRVFARYVHLAGEIGHLIAAVRSASRVRLGLPSSARRDRNPKRPRDIPGQMGLFGPDRAEPDGTEPTPPAASTAQ